MRGRNLQALDAARFVVHGTEMACVVSSALCRSRLCDPEGILENVAAASVS